MPMWRTTLRANLILWPEVAPNIAALARADGSPYDEAAIAATLPGANSAENERAVRQTAEILFRSGLAYKDVHSQEDLFKLTALGRCAFSFLGVTGGRRFANDASRQLLAELMIRALSLDAECCLFWEVMLYSEGALSNEELNRSLLRLSHDVRPIEIARDIASARVSADPTVIGPRIYEDLKYLTIPADQRKAMNPLFLLWGGGRLYTDWSDDDHRRLETWAIPLIEGALRERRATFDPGTEPLKAKAMSAFAGAPDGPG